jgi:hypothetical protein
MTHLPTIDSVVVSKKALMNHRKRCVRGFKVKNKSFLNQRSEINDVFVKLKQMQGNNERSSDSSGEEIGMYDYLPTDYPISNQFESAELATEMTDPLNTNLREEVEEFLLAVSILHLADRKLNSENLLCFKSLFADDVAQLNFAKSLGFTFKSVKDGVTKIKKNLYGRKQQMLIE